MSHRATTIVSDVYPLVPMPVYAVEQFERVSDEIVPLLSSLSEAGMNRRDTRTGRTFFVDACREGHLETVRLLLDNPIIDVNTADFGDRTPIFHACAHGHTEIVRLLLRSQRVDVMRCGEEGVTPLHVACARGHADAAAVLLADGRVDPNARDWEGMSPLYYAAEDGSVEVVDVLLSDARVKHSLQAEDGATPLIAASLEGRVEVVRRLLAAGQVEVNEADVNGTSALHVAAANGHADIVRMLSLHRGVALNRRLRHDRRYSAFQLACKFDRPECVRLFLDDHRVPIDAGDLRHVTPLRSAARGGRMEVVKLLLADGRRVELGSRVASHRTPLVIFETENNGHHAVATLLREFGEDQKGTRARLRLETGVAHDYAAALYAQVVFLSDGLLRVRRRGQRSSRFFAIAARLPLELQMVLCNRQYGVAKDSIPSTRSEPAFTTLTARLSWQ